MSTILIKRYKNRKLYDTSKSRYVNLPDIYDLAKQSKAFKVLDYNDLDITKDTLYNALVEAQRTKVELYALLDFIQRDLTIGG